MATLSLSVADWDLCTGRNSNERGTEFCPSVADWDLIAGRQLGGAVVQPLVLVDSHRIINAL